MARPTPATSTASAIDAGKSSSLSTPASSSSASSLSAAKAVTSIPPQPLTGAVAMLPSAANASSASSPAPAPATATPSITSKDWVVPPRPKPGRKPATDTPPTKRKAQNRAAQRAFRERRAARVGELEEQLQHQRREQDEKERTGTERVHALELELQAFKSQCAMLQDMLEKERQEAVKVLAELQTLRQIGEISSSSSNIQPRKEEQSSSSNHHHIPGRESRQPLQISQMISPPSNSPQPDGANEQGCGSCQPNGPCACAEAIADVMNSTCGRCGPGSSSCECFEAAVNAQPPPPQDHKRRLSPPPQLPEEKRLKPNASGTTSALESDFTTTSPRNPCGFCYGSNFCACENAQLATATYGATYGTAYGTTHDGTGDSLVQTSSATRTNHQQMHTPPPCDTDPAPTPMEITMTGAVKLPKLRRTPAEVSAPSLGRCGPNGPGTCQQCKLDPRSGNFCRALAAKTEIERGPGGPKGGCCGSRGGPGEGCCRSGEEAPPSGGLMVSCAEAYRKLSSHEAFGEAAQDVGSWVSKLKAAPAAKPAEPSDASPTCKPGTARHPFEVEAASVMSVLKEFDVRFGRDR